MLDTLMVLLMKGFRAPFLRAFMAFLFLCAGIGALLLLITLSGVRWPGMAATASSVITTSQGPISAPAPTAPIPHILHNPYVASPTASTTPGAPRSQNKGYNAPGVQQPGYNYTPPASTDLTPTNPIDGAIPGQEPSVIRSILDPLP